MTTKNLLNEQELMNDERAYLKQLETDLKSYFVGEVNLKENLNYNGNFILNPLTLTSI
jgi:hypothetical protein